mmetsp:Transcript_2871/g.6698  ORF Transcript_2871/g.6698 Transcript_2871/m.6698 type:complete len:570 (-) Transcript_2871:271-1980(-)
MSSQVNNAISLLPRALRGVMAVISFVVVIESVKTASSPRPQAFLAACLAIGGLAGGLCQIVDSKLLVAKLPFTRGTRDIEARMLLGGFLSLFQCTMMMRTNASGGIYMTWITFIASVLNLVIWLLLLMHLDGLLARAIRNWSNSRFFSIKAAPPSREKIGMVLLVTFLVLGWVAGVLLPWDDVAKHDSRYNAIRKTLTSAGSDAAKRAEAYWKTQEPHIKASLQQNFTLHPYFSHTEVWEGARWDEIINQRITAMGRQLDNEGKKGFMIEKDKCAMFEFFQRQGIPIPKIVQISRDHETTVKMLRTIQKNRNDYSWPLFLKGCHLTQGSDKGMMPLKAKYFEPGQLESNVLPWLRKKWDQRPNDSGRAWAVTMNRLLDTLAPGMAIQGPFRGMRVSPYNTPLEVKVEVIWGRAYLGLFADYHDVIALRDGSLEFTCRDRACPEWWSHGNSPDTRLQWAVENGHMEKVWTLAEQAAQRIGIDEARIDIFIDPARPDAPVVNEISLSSGHEYMYHTDYLAKAWAAPHLEMAKGRKDGSPSSQQEGKYAPLRKHSNWPIPKIRQTSVEVHLQ